MSTQAQITANQQNSQLSTGPITEEGKVASSQNAKTHGIFARVVPAEETAFTELADSLKECYGPVGAIEITIVEQIALAYFRLQRLYAYEQSATSMPEYVQRDLEELNYQCEQQGVKVPVMGVLSIMAHEAAKVATMKLFLESGANRLLTRYESMLNRQIQKNLEMLDGIQKARKANEQAAADRAREDRKQQLKRRMGAEAFVQEYVWNERTLDEIEEMLNQTELPAEAESAAEPTEALDSPLERLARSVQAARTYLENHDRHAAPTTLSARKSKQTNPGKNREQNSSRNKRVPLAAAGRG